MPGLRTTASLESLPAIRDFVLGWAKDEGIPVTLEPKLDLVLEEVLVNVAHHAYGGEAGEVEVICTTRSGGLCCTVRDWGTPFNPLESEPPDIDAPMDERPIGGLGLMLVTTMSDECSYAREAETNELTFCFTC